MAADSPAAHSPAHTVADNLAARSPADRMAADNLADHRAADIPADHRAVDSPHTPADHIAAAHSRFAARSPDHRHHWARSRHSGHSPAPADNCPAKNRAAEDSVRRPRRHHRVDGCCSSGFLSFLPRVCARSSLPRLRTEELHPPARGLSRKRLNRALHDNASYSIAQKNGL